MDLMDCIAIAFGLIMAVAVAWSNWPRKTSNTSFEPTDYSDWIV